MLEERICHYEKVRNLQAACEKNWQHSVSLRRQRDREELDFRRYGTYVYGFFSASTDGNEERVKWENHCNDVLYFLPLGLDVKI